MLNRPFPVHGGHNLQTTTTELLEADYKSKSRSRGSGSFEFWT